MNIIKLAVALSLGLGLAACDEGLRGYPSNKTTDRGIDKKDLSQLEAGIWVDPNGCDHWIIDDGLEGYLSQRLDPYGKPVCSGVAPPTQTVGDFKSGSRVPDPN